MTFTTHFTVSQDEVIRENVLWHFKGLLAEARFNKDLSVMLIMQLKVSFLRAAVANLMSLSNFINKLDAHPQNQPPVHYNRVIDGIDFGYI